MKHLTTLLGILIISSSLSYAQANCKETPPDGLSPLAAYSLFYGNYRQGDYEFALKYGRWMACAKPKTLEGNPQFSLKKQYDRLVTIYDNIGRNLSDPAARSAHIDTALTLIDESLELFGDNSEDRFDIVLNRGRFYQQNYNYIDDGLQKAYDDYFTLFEINAQKALNLGDGYYLRLALNNLIGNDEKEKAQTLIDAVKPIASGDQLAFIEDQQKELLGSPEEQVAYYEPLVKEDPSDVEAWKALRNAYDDLGNRAKLKNASIKVLELEPSFDNALQLAELAKGNASYAEAAKYFNEALKFATDDEQKKEAYLDLADVNINLEKLSAAKNYVQKALELDANDGRSYIKMATIYGAAVQQCTDDRKLQAQDKVVYWVVIDYLNKAKNVDSSVASTVNNQLSTYQEVAPNTEDKFFTLSLEDGDNIKVDGSLMDCYSWINETTTVR